MLIIWTQTLYLLLSLAMTVYVAQSLHKQGRVFLLRTFDDDEKLADSVNHLLIVGFYLLNIGWMMIWTRYGEKPGDTAAAIEFTTTKLGVAMLVLGGIHLFNVRCFWKLGHPESLKQGNTRTPRVTAAPPKLP